MKKWICCFFGIAFLCNSAFGQSSQVLSSLLAGSNFSRNTAGDWTGTATFNPPRSAPLTIVGAPFSADESQQFVQTLANGVHITNSFPGPKIYRDSQGRTRIEMPAIRMPNPDASNTPASRELLEVQIHDSVAGVYYVLDPVNKVVHRLQAPARSQPGRFSVPSASSNSRITNVPIAVTQALPAAVPKPPQVRKESLGSRDFHGVLADGERQITTYETGSQGNDAPFDVVTEIWTSPQLKLRIMSKTMDPRTGDSIFELKNLSADEPDPSLFIPPPDYRLVDETGQFTITFK